MWSNDHFIIFPKKLPHHLIKKVWIAYGKTTAPAKYLLTPVKKKPVDTCQQHPATIALSALQVSTPADTCPSTCLLPPCRPPRTYPHVAPPSTSCSARCVHRDGCPVVHVATVAVVVDLGEAADDGQHGQEQEGGGGGGAEQHRHQLQIDTFRNRMFQEEQEKPVLIKRLL